MNPDSAIGGSRRPQMGGRTAAAAGRVLDYLRFGIVVAEANGTVLDANETAQRIVIAAHGRWPDGATCCSLFGCRRHEPLDRHCIARLAAGSEEPLSELRIGLPAERPTRAAWITASRLDGDSSTVLMHLRPAPLHDRRRRTPPHWTSEPQLRIRALGRTQVEVEGIAVDGDWLMQRPGQLLKYLVCRRGRPAHVDEIVEAIWPRAERPGRSTVRYFVHALRERLEPGRPSRARSAFITSTGSTYALDPSVALDVDEFESLASVASQVPARSLENRPDVVASLKQAVDLYRGDLFEEEPFAEWAFPERERLRSLAYQALTGLVEHYRANGDAAAASGYLERCIDLWPLDTGLHHALVGLLLEQGRHGDAQRRYTAFRKRMQDMFNEGPGFELSDFASGRDA
jgi:DNA-binding SARP family transcriptional activator